MHRQKDIVIEQMANMIQQFQFLDWVPSEFKEDLHIMISEKVILWEFEVMVLLQI